VVEPAEAVRVATTLDTEARPLEISLETEATMEETSETTDEAIISALQNGKYLETRQISIVRWRLQSQQMILRLPLSSQ
jgi:hypothetical protein